MLTIQQITTLYSKQIDYLDIELIISNSLAKSREFVLAHPEFKLTTSQQKKITTLLDRRSAHEPIAHILGNKEFYGLNFIVNKHTLVPRPETEQMVELAVQDVERETRNTAIIDIGTGSGNIIISIAKKLDSHLRGNDKTNYFGIDISKEALIIAKKNSKFHILDKKIKFLHGSLLDPLLKDDQLIKLKPEKLIITANLPYLSKEIYNSAPIDVKKYEPKSALYSPEAGLSHYKKLLKQIKKLLVVSCRLSVVSYFEVSPEQKQPLTKLIKNIFPSAKIEFKKDLANKWRICKITL